MTDEFYTKEFVQKCKDAYDALESGLLDTADIKPYMDTIKEALQIAGIKMKFLEQERMIGKMEMATGVKVRLDMDIAKADVKKFVDDFLAEYKIWFAENRK